MAAAALAALVALVPVIPAACIGGAADAGESAPTVRDSAGVTIVESRAPRWGEGEGWTVEPEPLLDLTETGEGFEHEFEWVGDGLALRGGGFAIAESRRVEVRLYDVSGDHLRTVGRRGEGPGEYTRIDGLLSLRGDSLGVLDRFTRRIGVYDLSGELGRVIRFPDLQAMDLVALPEGGFLAQQTSFSLNDEEVELGPQRQEAPLVRIDGDGGLGEVVAVGAGFEHIVVESDGRIGDIGTLFLRAGQVAVRGDALYMGDADSLAYDVRDTDGELRRRVRAPGFDLTAPDALLEAERAFFREAWRDGGPDVGVIPDPATIPAYSDLAVDALGNVWLRAYLGRSQANEPTRWRVFDPEGAWLGEVVLPPRFTVFEITGDRILGVRLDDLDVPHPQVLGLDRGGA